MRRCPGSGEQAGVALVVTLLMMSVLTMMVVGLAGVMRNEQAAARNLTYRVLAEQMAEIGAREAMATVLSNSPTNGVPSATGPGWTMTNGVRVPLFTSNSENRMVDLEKVGTNSMILSVFSGESGSVRADWTNVVAPSAASNFPVGRYAWWVDDEGTKANLNQVGAVKTNPASTTSLLPLQTNFPLNYLMVFATESGAATTSTNLARLAGRTHRLFSTEMLKDNSSGPTNTGAETFRSYKGQITAWSSNGADLTPWGTPRVNLNTASLTEIQQALSTNALESFFGAGTSLGRKYGGGGAGATNTDNHGDLVIRQIAANILAARGSPVTFNNADYYSEANLTTGNRRTRHGIPQTISSFSRTPYLDAVRARVEFRRSGVTLVVRLGVWVNVVNPYNQAFENYSVVVRPRKFRFQIASTTDMTLIGSPGFGSPLEPLPPSTTFVEQNGRSIWAGPSTLEGAEQYWWPWDEFMSTNIPAIPARSSGQYLLTTSVTFTFSANPTSSTVPQAYVILDQVGLYSSATPTTTTLVDWLNLDDLNHSDNFRSASPDPGQFAFSATSVAPNNRGTSAFLAGTNASSWTTANSIGVKRIDPQTRFSTLVWDSADLGTLKSGGWPASVKAWTTSTSESNNMRTPLLSYLPTDPVPSTLASYTNHPHFVQGYVPTNGFLSVAQLGAVHTGLPWRTLRFLPTPAAELAQGPPDWVLLDMFSATNPAVTRSMININSVGLERGGLIQVNGAVEHRGMVPAAAVGPLINSLSFFQTASNNLVAWGVPVSFATDDDARIAPTGTNLSKLGSALGSALASPGTGTNWYTNPTASLNSAWGSFRATSNVLWPTQGMAFRGEVAELPFWNQAGTNQAVSTLSEEKEEGRMRFFMDLLTTRSDTFTVWSAGQGLAVASNALGLRTNVMAEVRRQTVFQRMPQTNANGAITGWQMKVLYTRDHVVE